MAVKIRLRRMGQKKAPFYSGQDLADQRRTAHGNGEVSAEEE